MGISSYLLKDGKFQTRSDLKVYFADDSIQCLICGKWLKVIGGQHLKKHGMTEDQYRERFGIPYGRGLCCQETAGKMSNSMRRRMERGDPTLMTIEEIQQKAWKAPKRGCYVSRCKELVAHCQTMADIKKEKSLEVVNSYDWELFIKTVEETQRAADYVCKLPGMPSPYHFYKKAKSDPAFYARYLSISKVTTVEERLGDKIAEATKQGLSQRLISIRFGISKTEVGRVQKYLRSKEAI
jgi:hypothetical protein